MPALAAHYKRIQSTIVQGLNREHKFGLAASDAFLLGHLPKEAANDLTSVQREMIGRFLRGDYYRFCLTP